MSEPNVLALVVLVLVAIGWYLSYSAARLDRLHARVQGTLAALDAQLVRRAEATLELANSGVLDAASALMLASAASDSLSAAEDEDTDADQPRFSHDREGVESRLSEALGLAPVAYTHLDVYKRQLALWAADCPIVATFHTSNLRSRAMQVSYPFFRASLEKILGRIAVSEDARRTVTTHFGGDAVVIPNGVYVDRFASAQLRPQWQGQPGRPTIAFLGRMGEPRKGMPVLAAALPRVLAQVPGLRLLVAGPGNADEVRASMTPEVASATEFLGSVDDADKATLLRSVDVLSLIHI